MSKLSRNISRRRSLQGGLLAVGGLFSTSVKSQNNRTDKYFRHGVASGDPDHSSVVIWTRLSDVQGEAVVTWQISDDSDFSQIRQQGRVTTGKEKDFTVKVLAQHLPPGGTYYYRFSSGETASPTGRTRTLPTDQVNSLGLAVVSCSNFAFGFFNAYEAIAMDEQVEYVLHLGDYIYEYGADGWGAQTGRQLGREHVPGHETVSLTDYRLRHAQYKSDLSSQRMHAAHPMIATWDDHESANNPWKGGAQNHQPDSEGSWWVRRDASIQAYFEWMPIREPGMGKARMDYWRTYQFGDLATLVTLETRHTGRAQQIDYDHYFESLDSPLGVQRFLDDVLAEPGRDMLSAAMQRDLETSLLASVAKGQPWRLIGNQGPLARMPVPDVANVLAASSDPGDRGLSGEGPDLAWKGRWGLPFYLDTWDGYPWAREQFYALCRRCGADDLVVLTGDSHSFWANQLYDAQGRSCGVEIGTAGVSSPGDFVENGYSAQTAAALDQLFAQQLPEVRWTDNMHQGYVRVCLDRQKAEVDYVAVDTVLRPSTVVETLRTETIVRDQGRLVYKSK